jgi:hypothetical protein
VVLSADRLPIRLPVFGHRCIARFMDLRDGRARFAWNRCLALARCLATALAPLVLTSVAAAQQAASDRWLEIERSPGSEACPDADTFSQRVLELVKHPSEGELPRVRIVLSRDSETLRAQISMRGHRSGERQLSAPASSCDELAEALVVALALMLDPNLPGMVSKSGPTTAETPTPPAAKSADGAPAVDRASAVDTARDTPRDRPTTEAERADRGARKLWLEGGGGVSQALDGMTPGALLGIELEDDGWYAAAHGLALTRTAALGRGSTSLWLLGGQVRAGAYWLGRATGLRWGGAVDVAAAALSASAEGYQTSSSTTRPWVAGGLATIVSTSAEPTVSYRMSVAILLPFLQETFLVENVGAAYETPVVTVWLDLLIAVRVL